MRIGVVDDDETVLEFVSQVLTSAGHGCSVFHRGQDLLSALQRDTFDLLILDWNMPVHSGIDLLDWTRTNLEAPPPVIMLTSRSDKDDIVTALRAGADDFIVKPETPAVICARVEAVMRRGQPARAPGRHETHGLYCFDRHTESVSVDGEPVVLTSKEFALAQLFFANLHKPLSRTYIMETVWKSMADLSTRTLDMHVSRIRSKLRLRSENGYRLQTVFGYGYRLESC